jgi:hypothetical protein
MSPAADNVIRRLDAARQKWWLFSLLTTAVLALCVSLGTLFVFMLTDALLKFSQVVLLGLFLAWLAVTITKDHDLSAPFVDAINTFYGRGDIPIGVVRTGPTPEASKFTVLANRRDGGKLRYPHDLVSGADAPEATPLLRDVLAGQPDRRIDS